MKKFFLVLVVAFACCFSGCITGELYIAPLSSILSRPYTAEEIPNFYERRAANTSPYYWGKVSHSSLKRIEIRGGN